MVVIDLARQAGASCPRGCDGTSRIAHTEGRHRVSVVGYTRWRPRRRCSRLQTASWFGGRIHSHDRRHRRGARPSLTLGERRMQRISSAGGPRLALGGKSTDPATVDVSHPSNAGNDSPLRCASCWRTMPDSAMALRMSQTRRCTYTHKVIRSSTCSCTSSLPSLILETSSTSFTIEARIPAALRTWPT